MVLLFSQDLRYFGALSRTFVSCLVALLVFMGAAGLQAQTFASGSDGTDGALNLTTPGMINFDPVALGLDSDGDGIFHFTTIDIAEDVVVRMSARVFTRPVFWLASGAVKIDGTIDLNGEDGQSGSEVLNRGDRVPSFGGAGGFGGGVGASEGSSSFPGKGLGGGRNDGAGAGYRGRGGCRTVCGTFNDSCCNDGGATYGNELLVPLMAGSGGGGGNLSGGGAGGGALLIASDTSITVDGTVQANGGAGGGFSGRGGGGGSGGAIRLAAPTISGEGTLTALGGASGGGRAGGGSSGRIRLEAFESDFSGTMSPSFPFRRPYGVFLPEGLPPSLVVVSVNGIPLEDPTGSFTPADVTIDTTAPVSVAIQARNIPTTSGDPAVPTVVNLHLLSENAPDETVESTPLSGTADESTATVTVTFPTGFTRAYVRAEWQP